MKEILAAIFSFAVLGRAGEKPLPARAPTHSAPSQRRAPPAPAVPPLAILPRVARVRVDVGRDHLVVVEDVVLPRADGPLEDLDMYVAFGAPGTPLAVDAHLVAAAPSASFDPRADEGDRVVTVPAARRDPAVHPLLGPPQMAGCVVRIRGSQLRRAYMTTDRIMLRLRSLLPAAAPATDGMRDVVVRLGVSSGSPLTLGRIEVGSLDSRSAVERVEATLCGPEADPFPLSVVVSDRAGAKTVANATSTIAPELAVRHSSDDLCIRWWSSP